MKKTLQTILILLALIGCAPTPSYSQEVEKEIIEILDEYEIKSIPVRKKILKGSLTQFNPKKWAKWECEAYRKLGKIDDYTRAKVMEIQPWSYQAQVAEYHRLLREKK